jgi:uncharacterized protein involved in exopolysaccharide biosynthesis
MEEKTREKEKIESLTLLDYLIIFAKYKILILGITLSVAIITFIMSLNEASFYIAETSILPPDKNVKNKFVNEIGFFPGIGVGSNIHNTQDLLVEIIKSRTLTDKLIEKYNLIQHYGTKNKEVARNTFYGNLQIEPDYTDTKRLLPHARPPLTRIYVSDSDSKKSAEIANGIVDELKDVLINIAISEASQRRLFFEEQLKKASEALIKSEEDIKMFQEETGVLTVETQTRMVVERIANLQAQITAKEIELEIMKSYSTVRNPDFQRIQETINVLRKELTKLEASESDSKNFLIPTGTIPELGLEYKRIYRQLKFNETLYEIMIKQYEIAKIDESKDAALVQIIDIAMPPENASIVRLFPRRKALLYTVIAFLFSCFLALFIEKYRVFSEKQEYREKIKILKGYLFSRGKS